MPYPKVHSKKVFKFDLGILKTSDLADSQTHKAK